MSPRGPVEITAPCPGRVIPLAEVPDPVFSSAMVGPGVAVDPEREATTVCAPLAGRVVKAHPHAFVIQGDGVAVLVHLGINTVKLKGEGFSVLAAEGAEVELGTPMVRWNPAEITADGMSPVVPVVALDIPEDAVSTLGDGTVETGDALFGVALS